MALPRHGASASLGDVTSATPAPVVAHHGELQRRTVRVLAAAQVLSGIGMASTLAVAGLLAKDLTGSESWAGLPSTAVTLGAALFAVPLARLAARRGRRIGLGVGWVVGAIGAAVSLLAAYLGWAWLLPLGMFGIGASIAAGFQSRYAAADLASPRSRARDLSLVIWATTIGSVLGPNLSGPGEAVAQWLSVPDAAGPLVFTLVALAGAALLVGLLLRPDPLLVAQAQAQAEAAAAPEPEPVAVPEQGVGGAPATPAVAAPLPRTSAWSAVRRSPSAIAALAAIVVGHVVMVSVMTMTPVHMEHHGADLQLVGLTISVHIAGMFALSPVFGLLADRWGRVPVLLLGQGLLGLATLVAGTAGHSMAQLTTGLFLLGVGWSAGLVAGSTLLAESVDVEHKPAVQGMSDLWMNLVGAAGAALSGVALSLSGYGMLNAFAAATLVVPVVLAVRARAAA